MSFTRSTTTTNVHSTLGDYPSVDDGLTPEQLKARFDSPATGLKSDINGLEDELEATTAAASLGADEIYEGDTSDANVQAKLQELYALVQEVVSEGIADGTVTTAKLAASAVTTDKLENGAVTSAKIDSSYDSTLAKKNNTLQTNLYAAKAANAEKLGGSTLANITALITATSHSIGSTTITNATECTINLGFKPSFVLFTTTNSTASIIGFPRFGVVIGDSEVVFDDGNDKWYTYTATRTSSGITLKGFASSSGGNVYTHNINYVAFR